MNTTKPYDPQQQQQQQQGGYTRPRSASVLLAPKPNGSIGTNGAYSASSTNLGASIPTGRPLPKTPGISSQPSSQQQQQQHQQNQHQHQQQTGFDASGDTGHINGYNAGSNWSNNSNNINNGNAVPSARSDRANIHINQPSNVSLASASVNNIPNHNNNNSNMGAASRGHSSWVQFKAAPSASTSFSNTTTSSNISSSASGAAYSTPSTLLTKLSQQHLHQQPAVQSQGPKVTQDEASSYYAALTRPISPTMIMNYVPPPVSNSGATPSTTTATTSQGGGGSNSMESPSQPIMSVTTTSSLRPLSATAALSSSFNTLGPGSQPAARPALHQGTRSSYMEPSNPPSTSSNQTPQQGRPLSVGGSSVISAISSNSGNNEDSSSNSSRFARRGPLVMSQESGSFGDHNSNFTPSGTRSRRESGAWSDVENGTPAQSLYRQSFHQQTPQQQPHHQHQQQPFSPATPRTDTSNKASPANTATFGMQVE